MLIIKREDNVNIASFHAVGDTGRRIDVDVSS